MKQKTTPWFRMFLVFTALALISGCANLRGSYVGNRAADFMEIAQVRIGYGGPFNLHAKATDYMSASLGLSSCKNVLLFGKGSLWAEEHHSGVGPNQATSSLWKDDGTFDYRFFGWHHSARHPVDKPNHPEWEHSSVMFVERPTGNRHFADMGDVSIGAAFLLNLELGLSLGQGADFFFGIIGVDFAEDDVYDNETSNPEPETQHQPLPKPETKPEAEPTEGPTIEHVDQ